MTSDRTEFRLKRQPSGTVDTDLFDLAPLRLAFNEFNSGATALVRDVDGTAIDDYPFGQRVEIEVSTDGGSTWSRLLAGFVTDRKPTTERGLTLLELDVRAYDHLLRRRNVEKTYSSSTLSTILKDVIETFTPVTWNASNVTVVNDKTITRTFQSERVDEVVGYLASESGNEEFGVNADLEFFFRPQDDAGNAPAIGDADVLDHSFPDEAKREINRYKLYYGPSGGRAAVVVEDRESQQELKDKLGAARGVELSDSDSMPEITDEDRAEAVARRRLDSRSQVQTGSVTLPLSRTATEPGDVLSLTVSDAGFTDVDFRVAQLDYFWRDLKTEVALAEQTGEEANEALLVSLSDSIGNARARDADFSVTPTSFLDLKSGVECTATVSAAQHSPASGAFVPGQDALGGDTLGGDVTESATAATGTAAVTAAGLDAFRDVWQGEAAPGVSHLAVGTDSADATRGDTALGAEVDRVTLDKFGTGGDAKTMEFDASAGGGVVADATGIQEMGIFDAASGGSLYLRATLDSALDLSGADSLHVALDLSLADDADEQGVITDKGQERLRDLFVGETGHEPSDMVYGTGTAAAATSDTALGSKQHEDTIDSTADRATGITDVVERITAGDADTTNFSEVGYENAADELLARVTFEAYGSDVVVETNYQLQVSNA